MSDSSGRAAEFDAVLVLSFGGPDGPEDVLPFLANVTRGRAVPPARLERVAAQYLAFGGRSPINAHNRALVQALRAEFESHGRPRPVYWGNRNWHPFLADTLDEMRRDGVGRAAVFVTSAYSSYSSCRQYLEDMSAARGAVGPGAPRLVKLRPFFNHPGFVVPLAEGLAAVWAEVAGSPGGAGAEPGPAVLMSGHSLPEGLAATCDYSRQLAETARLVAETAGLGTDTERWMLVYQSRSGPPAQPWLGPDVVDAIAALDRAPAGGAVIVVPIGFVSDHMEVMHDLDTQAAEAARTRGLRLFRSPTPGSHPRFVHMVCELIDELERPGTNPPRTLGTMAPAPFPCPAGCCPGPQAPGVNASEQAGAGDRR